MTEKRKPANGSHITQPAIAWFLWVAASFPGFAAKYISGFIIWYGEYYFSGWLYVVFVHWVEPFIRLLVFIITPISQWAVLKHYLGFDIKTLWIWVPLDVFGYFFASNAYGLAVVMFWMGAAESGGMGIVFLVSVGVISGGVAGLILGFVQMFAMFLCQLEVAKLMRIWFPATISGFVLGSMVSQITFDHWYDARTGIVDPSWLIMGCCVAIFQGYAITRLLGPRADSAH